MRLITHNWSIFLLYWCAYMCKQLIVSRSSGRTSELASRGRPWVRLPLEELGKFFSNRKPHVNSKSRDWNTKACTKKMVIRFFFRRLIVYAQRSRSLWREVLKILSKEAKSNQFSSWWPDFWQRWIFHCNAYLLVDEMQSERSWGQILYSFAATVRL